MCWRTPYSATESARIEAGRHVLSYVVLAATPTHLLLKNSPYHKFIKVNNIYQDSWKIHFTVNYFLRAKCIQKKLIRVPWKG